MTGPQSVRRIGDRKLTYIMSGLDRRIVSCSKLKSQINYVVMMTGGFSIPVSSLSALADVRFGFRLKFLGLLSIASPGQRSICRNSLWQAPHKLEEDCGGNR